MLPEITWLRLRGQLDTVPLMLAGVDPAAAEWRPAAGKWSAREQLAHIARLHQVTEERLRRILTAAAPPFSRYRAEEDAEWPQWVGRPLGRLTAELPVLRAHLVATVESIPSAALYRHGVHSTMGAVPIPTLLEFFLLHEAHHLYAAMQLLLTAPRAQQ